LKDIIIGGKKIGIKNPVFVIAEAGINHNGSITIAKKLIRAAKKAGADCIKFQTHIPEKEMLKTNVQVRKNSKKTLWDIMKECELTGKQELELKKYCKEQKIIFLSTPFSIDAVNRLNKIKVPAFKIGSGELTNLPFLIDIAKKKKPVILSTGMSNLKEITEAVNLFKKYKTPLILLQTTSTYPTDYSDINLGVLEKFMKNFGVIVGISDHSIGIYTALGAVAKGACVVEKHFTLDKNMSGPDQKLSLEPNEFEELVKGCHAVKLALGNSKEILNEEKPIIKFARESVVTIKDIKKNEQFTLTNISTKRPYTGEIHANQFYKILGKKAKRSILSDKQIAWVDIS